MEFGDLGVQGGGVTRVDVKADPIIVDFVIGVGFGVEVGRQPAQEDFNDFLTCLACCPEDSYGRHDVAKVWLSLGVRVRVNGARTSLSWCAWDL